MIRLESILNVKETKYYCQTFLECKYDIKNIERNRHIDFDFEKSSSDESDNEHRSETESETEDDESKEPS